MDVGNGFVNKRSYRCWRKLMLSDVVPMAVQYLMCVKFGEAAKIACVPRSSSLQNGQRKTAESANEFQGLVEIVSRMACDVDMCRMALLGVSLVFAVAQKIEAEGVRRWIGVVPLLKIRR